MPRIVTAAYEPGTMSGQSSHHSIALPFAVATVGIALFSGMDAVMKQLHPGAVILFHDTLRHTAEALPEVIRRHIPDDALAVFADALVREAESWAARLETRLPRPGLSGLFLLHSLAHHQLELLKGREATHA